MRPANSLVHMCIVWNSLTIWLSFNLKEVIVLYITLKFACKLDPDIDFVWPLSVHIGTTYFLVSWHVNASSKSPWRRHFRRNVFLHLHRGADVKNKKKIHHQTLKEHTGEWELAGIYKVGLIYLLLWILFIPAIGVDCVACLSAPFNPWLELSSQEFQVTSYLFCIPGIFHTCLLHQMSSCEKRLL